jgi:hypothetical protein
MKMMIFLLIYHRISFILKDKLKQIKRNICYVKSGELTPIEGDELTFMIIEDAGLGTFKDSLKHVVNFIVCKVTEKLF